MEILQPTWRGRSIASRKDSSGQKHTAMVGPKSLLYIPVNILPNAVYKVTLDLCRESGNGILYCNLYGNRNFDFHHSKIICESNSWNTFDVDVITKDFPKTVPIVFRLWRGKEGTGTILVRRITVQLEEGSVEQINTTGQVVSVKGTGALPTSTESSPNTTPQPRQRPARKQKAVTAKVAPSLEFFKHHNSVPDGKKVLYLPANNTQIFQTGMYDAFIQNGFELYTFDFRNFYARNKNVSESLLRICREFRPDWIHMQLQFTGMVPSATIRAIKSELPSVKITNWTGDIRAEIKPYFIEIGRCVDVPLISSEGQVSLYKKYGCPNVEYWQIGIDPKVFHPLSKAERNVLHLRMKHDVSFCAIKTNHFPDSALRQKIVNALSKSFGTRFAIYGDGWGRLTSARGRVGYYGQNGVYNGSKIAINVNHFNNVELYFSDRQLITMASGTPVICKYIPGLERYFENRVDVIWFNTPAECVELVAYYLKHPEEAEKIGQSGAKKVLEQHSYYIRVKELAMRMGLIKSSPESIGSKRNINKNDILKVLGVLPTSSDSRFRFRTTIGKIEFQGALMGDNIKRMAAEFQPDLVYLYNDANMMSLAKQIREMDEHVAICCFAENISADSLSKLSSFDYVLVNNMPEGLVSQKPAIIGANVDVSIQNKKRSDVVAEILCIVGDKS